MMKPMYTGSRGFSLLTVIFAVLVTAIAGAVVISLISTSAQMVVDEYRAQQAFDMAQAGISYTAQELAGDDDWSDNTGGTVNYGPGFFTSTFIEQTVSTATVRSVGDVDGTTRTVEQEFSRGIPACFEGVIYTEDNFTATGGSDLSIEGPVATSGTVDVTGNASVDMPGPIDDNHAGADMPDVDWSYWKGVADHVILGDYMFGDGTYNGIYYVAGKTTIVSPSSFTLNGSIISRGMVQITTSSNVTITASGTNPAIVAESRIKIDGNTNVAIAGWLFTLGDFLMTSTQNFSLDGGIAAAGEIKMTGNSIVDVDYALDRVPDVGFIGGEPGGDMGESSIVFGDWTEEL